MDSLLDTESAYYKKFLEKIRTYCNFQERCLNEVQEKLIKINVQQSHIELIIKDLIKDNFINEERFAKNYVKGKFENKKWGRRKIVYKLQLKKVSENYINIGLNEISEEEYIKTIKDIILSKQKEIKDKNSFSAKYKLANYLISKGYETDMVWQVLNSIR